MVAALDASGGFVRAHDPRRLDLLGDRGGLGGERFSGARQEVAQAALADGEAEHFVQQHLEPRQPDRMRVMEIDDQRRDRLAEGRARLQPRRGRRHHRPAAAPALAAEQSHARHIRGDRHKLDPVIDS